jgi:hypothetical protein
MLTVSRITQSLEEVLKGPELNAEEQLLCDSLVPTVLFLQEHPDLALMLYTGITIPTHERTMLYQEILGALQNIYICSRGTAKSTTIQGLAAVHDAWVNANRDAVLLHAGGFRGGQMLFNEVQRWIEGGWDSQEQGLRFLADSIRSQKIVTRQASYWEINLDSHSKYTTLPTNEPDKILGMRAKRLRIDEAVTADPQLIEKTAMPFLNVKGDFRHGGAYAASNSVSFTTTIDYTFRPFMRYVRAAKGALDVDYAAYKALLAKNVAKYKELGRDGFGRYTYTSFDYTDLMIRKELVDHDGTRYEVQWPNADIPLTHLAGGIPFTERAPDGMMAKQGRPLDVYVTYPVDIKQLEGPLRDGSADESTWKAEQRNVEDAAAGDVYPNALVDDVSCFGDRYVLPASRLGEEWARVKGELDFVPPVLWRCQDPCVIGVDYAGGERDFTTFCVIRMGPMSTLQWNPLTGEGTTPWSNVIWCEQHHRTSHDDVRAKLHQLMERYNVIYFHDKNEDDPWRVCRGIGLDMRGGGQGVRDSLVYINDETPPAGSSRIYDPLDRDERVIGFSTDVAARPMLDCIWPQDTLNEKLVEFTKGQMQAKLLYIPKFLQPSERGPDRALDPAYEASRILTQQLRKLQQENTARARRFYMPGNKEAVEGKKDLWSAFLYASKQLRAHLIRFQLIRDTPPPTGGRVTRIGSKRGMKRGGMHGPAVGSKRF